MEGGAGRERLKLDTRKGSVTHGQGLVDDHVREEERDEQEVAVLANRLDAVGIRLLLSA